MTKLVWGNLLDRVYKVGVDRGVVYSGGNATVWNGLTSVKENTVDSELTDGYYNGDKYIQERTPEGFSGTIEAFTYPDQVDNPYTKFDLTYRTMLNVGYEIHLVYNVRASSKNVERSTFQAQAEAALFGWDISSVPVPLADVRASSHLIINSNDVLPGILSALEDTLYGTESTAPSMPTGPAVITLFDTMAIFRVVDNGDGTWTATGPDDWFEMLDSTTFQIVTPSAEYLDPDLYKVGSW